MENWDDDEVIYDTLQNRNDEDQAYLEKKESDLHKDRDAVTRILKDNIHATADLVEELVKHMHLVRRGMD